MARHRDIPKMVQGWDEEDDDDYTGSFTGSPSSASPGTAMMYTIDRSKQTASGINFSSFLTPKPTTPKGRKAAKQQNDDEDEDAEMIEASLPRVYDTLGTNTFDKDEIVDALRKHNYDIEKTIGHLLEKLPDTKEKESEFDMEMEEEKKPQKPPVAASRVLEIKAEPSKPKEEVSPLDSSSSLESSVKSLTLSDAPKTPSKGKKEEEKTPTVTRQVVKQMSIARRKEIEEKTAAKKEDKEHINLVVIGHVDAGKSTIMGHLLYLLGHVNDRTIHKYEKDSKARGKGSFMWAWVLDEHEEERNRGITMDVGITSFETPHRKVTLLDAPGHRDFVPNMISGAAQADVALLVIDAIAFESGFENDGQTKEHALLAKSLGVQQLGVVINKLDTVEWSEERYNQIIAKLGQFLKQSGYKDSSVWFLPASGLSGENLIKKQEPKLDWYKGPTLAQRIDEFKPAAREISKPFRFCVSDIYRASNLGAIAVGGKIESGIVSSGDKLLLMPLNEICSVKGIRLHFEQSEFAAAGDNAEIGLTGIEPSHVNMGSILCDPEFPVSVTNRFKAHVITFSLQRPIIKGQQVEFFYSGGSEPAVLPKLIAVLDKVTGEVKSKNPRVLNDSTTALVEVKLARPLCIEKYSDFKQLGRFTLRESGRTIAAGIVTEIL